MNERFPFQFSILRYHHDIATGEFINVGLALYSESAQYFRVQLLSRYRRITQAFPGADGELFRRYIEHLQRSFDKITSDFEEEQIYLFGERFTHKIEHLLESVLPKDDTAIRFSKPKGGASENLTIEFEQLFYSLIEKYLSDVDVKSRDDNEIWQVFRPGFKDLNILHQISKHAVRTEVESFEFEHAYKNGHWNVLEPVSFDLVNPGSIRKKGKERLGTALILDEYSELSNLYYLLGRPRNGNRYVIKAFDDVRRMLEHKFNRLEVMLIEEDEAEDFARHVENELNQ